MDECLRELQSLSVITKEQHHKLGTGEEEWEKVAEIIRKDAQKYLKLIDVLEHHEEAMSPVLIMLKKKYSKTVFQLHFFECMPISSILSIIIVKLSQLFLN